MNWLHVASQNKTTRNPRTTNGVLSGHFVFQKI
jgi:hypothetical protein